MVNFPVNTSIAFDGKISANHSSPIWIITFSDVILWGINAIVPICYKKGFVYTIVYSNTFIDAFISASASFNSLRFYITY